MQRLDSRLRGNDMKSDSIEQLVLTAKFVGANPNPEVVVEGQLEYNAITSSATTRPNGTLMFPTTKRSRSKASIPASI
jgi:hypothetical protein